MPALFLVALVPPEPVFSQVWALKQQVHERTGSRNAVRLLPHITLIPPTRQPDAFEEESRAGLRAFAATQSPFAVGLHGFDWFDSRTLFVRVSEAEPLRAFHAALGAWCGARLPAIPQETRPFTPHMTLATRDVPKDLVPQLKSEFAARAFAARFGVQDFSLFRHDGRLWERLEDFPMTGPDPLPGNTVI